MLPRILRIAVVLCLYPGVLGAEEPTSQPDPPRLTLAEYVKGYLELSNQIREAKIAIEEQNIEISRTTSRSIMEVSANPNLGLHHYQYTAGDPSHHTVAFADAKAQWLYRRNNGQTITVDAHTYLPTKQQTLAGNIAYGIGGKYALPLLRNRFGRQFAMEAEAQRHLRDRIKATLEMTKLTLCHDAIRRFIERYVAQEQLRVYQELLKRKKRIWYQTSADYRKKMITRLDLLAAKSDWITAKSREPQYRASLARADAALRAFLKNHDGNGKSLLLAKPTGLTTGESVDFKEEEHPRFIEIVSTQKALATEQGLLVEQNRSDLDLTLSLGIDRYHRSYAVADASAADATDITGVVGLRYLFPIERPDVVYRDRLLRLSSRKLDEQAAQARRAIGSQASQAVAVARESEQALALIDQQQKIVEQQIRAAFREFRAGKLQFQNFLDHWERYQSARLSRWDTQRLIWVAAADLILHLNRRPEFCQ